MDSATWSDSLNRLLQSRGAEKLVLPPLKEEPGWIAKIGRRLFEWFTSQLRPGFDVPHLKDFIVVAIWGVILLVAAAAIYAIVLTVRSFTRRKVPAARGPEPVPQTNRENYLERALDEARLAGRLSEAARLRWKIFLHRRGLSGALTPLEHLHDPQVYRLMFVAGDDAAFEAWHHLLTRLEAGADAR